MVRLRLRNGRRSNRSNHNCLGTLENLLDIFNGVDDNFDREVHVVSLGVRGHSEALNHRSLANIGGQVDVSSTNTLAIGVRGLRLLILIHLDLELHVFVLVGLLASFVLRE